MTASVLFPDITGTQILGVLGGGSVLAVVPPLSELPRPELTTLNLAFLTVLRGYLFIAGGLVLVRIAQLIAGGH